MNLREAILRLTALNAEAGGKPVELFVDDRRVDRFELVEVLDEPRGHAVQVFVVEPTAEDARLVTAAWLRARAGELRDLHEFAIDDVGEPVVGYLDTAAALDRFAHELESR